MKFSKEDMQLHEGDNSEVQAIIAQLNDIVKDWQASNEAEEADFKEQKDGEMVQKNISFDDVADAWNDKIEPLFIQFFKLNKVEIDPKEIKLPLSKIDYLRIRGINLLDNGYCIDFWNNSSPELHEAYDDMMFDCLYQKYPNCGACDEDVIWVKPRSITIDNVGEIEDTLAWWVAMKYIIKEMVLERNIYQALEKVPELKTIIEKIRDEKQDDN